MNLNICIEIGNTVSNTWNLVDDTLVKLNVGIDIELSSGHGAHSCHVLYGTWVELLRDDVQTIGGDFDSKCNIALNGRNTDDIECECSIIWCEYNVE